MRGEVPITVIGHSYGGLTTALAATAGLTADQLLLVNSPGVGSLISVPALAEYSVYAVSAPGDRVSELCPLIHGPAPTSLDGVIDLETGGYLDGSLVAGVVRRMRGL